MWRRVARHVEDDQIERLRELVDDGQLGGEHDGEISRMEWCRLAYWRWFWQQRPRRER